MHDTIPGFTSGHPKQGEEPNVEVLEVSMFIVEPIWARPIWTQLHFAKEVHANNRVHEEYHYQQQRNIEEGRKSE